MYMKKFFVLILAFVALFAQDALAQDKPAQTEAQKAEAKARREQLMLTRLELLKTELQLNDEQFAKFEPVYRRFRSEVSKVTSMNREARTKRAEITNENALKVLSARPTNTIMTSAVKQRYLYIFAEVLEPLKVMTLYRVDDRISREAQKVMKYRQTATQLDAKK
jgi:hypothetical protein